MIRKLCALMLVLGLAVLPAAAFSDVEENAWYREAAEYVSQQELMLGVSGDVFAPELQATRGMVATVLYRMEGHPAVSGTASFPDVTAGAWYADAVAWAEGAGLVTGYDSGAFGPGDIVTREQLAVILMRYAGYRGDEIAEGVLGGFSDAGRISAWALEGVRHAVGAGLLNGVDGGLLNPGGAVTRAELAQVLYRLMIPVAG